MTTTPVTAALTLHRPWAAAILHGTKRTENRTWAPRNPPGRIGLHAGRTIDPHGEQRLLTHLGLDELPDDAWDQGLIGTARLTDTHPATDCPRAPTCRVWGASTGWHWVLSDVRALDTPLPSPGRQRLWRLTPHQTRTLAQATPVPDPTSDLEHDAAWADLITQEHPMHRTR